jgi:uncharacterized protein YegP (UPF0339 family)
VTDLTRSELDRAITQIRDWPNPDTHRAMLLRLPPNERDHILLLAALLDATPVPNRPKEDPVHLMVFRGNDNQWYVRQVAANHQTLATSEGYTRKADALRAARTINPDLPVTVIDPPGEPNEDDPAA